MSIVTHPVGSDPATAGHAQRRRVLVSIPNGFQLRQFVHSGVLDRLVGLGFTVRVVSPNREGEGFTAALPEGVEIRTLDPGLGPLHHRYLAVRKHLLYQGPQTETLRQHLVKQRRQHPVSMLVARFGSMLFRLFPRLHRLFLKWEYVILSDRDVDALLDDGGSISLVLTTTPGYGNRDAFLLHAAVRRGIPVVASVLSWDNITTKCFVNPMPDKLLVWSDHMRDEAAALQGIPRDQIVVTGPPQYDIFSDAARFGSRSENLAALGLDAGRRVLFYGTNHAGFFPDEIEVVRCVARWVEDDALGAPCQLVVRLHPQAVLGPYKLLTEDYFRLASDRVRVELPPVVQSRLLWELPASDLEHLVRLLRDADVVINTASTISIDAAVFDRPVIAVAYDPAGEVSYERSVRRYYDYTHMARVVRAGAMRLAGSPEDLRNAIAIYLEQPALEREGRKRIVEQQFGTIDGDAAARVVREVTTVLSRRNERRGSDGDVHGRFQPSEAGSYRR